MKVFALQYLFPSERESHFFKFDFLDPCSTESYRITVAFLSLRQFGIFLRNRMIIFRVFLHHRRWLEYLKTDRELFFRKIHFSSNLGKKDPKSPQNRSFWIFWKILSLVVPGNNLKWKLVLILISHHQPHIWKNSWSRVMNRNAVGQSDCKTF